MTPSLGFSWGVGGDAAAYARSPLKQGECGCLKVAVPLKEGTLRVQATNSPGSFEVTTDGAGVVGHAGAALLRELADRVGLTGALGWRGPRAAVGIRTRRCCGIWRCCWPMVATA